MKFTEIITEGEKGLWANIHAKRDRIKHGSGEKMRKPGSKGAPSAQNFKDAATEDANPKRQAAIAIAKKEQGVTENNQRGDSLVTDALKIMRGSDFQIDPVKAIKTVLGDREYNSRRGFYNFYVRQLRDLMDQEGLAEDWQKVNKSDKTDGMSSKAVKSYRRENPGSKLKTAVTKKPSELKAGSKDANRRKSFCARMSGMKKHNAGAKTKRDPDSPINKALRRWNCESIEQMQELVMIAEQKIRKLKK
jgi:hypothetical protein